MGWRLIQRGEYWLIWKNTSTKSGAELQIYDLGARTSAKPSGLWYGYYGNHAIFLNATKTQAISKAKSWMRKHPNFDWNGKSFI